MPGPYTVTNDTAAPAARTIRLSDGRTILPGKSVVVQDNEVDQNILDGISNSYLSSVPAIPMDAASLARYASTADKDPVFPQTAPSAHINCAGAIASPGVGFLPEQGNHKVAAAAGEGEAQILMTRAGSLKGMKLRSTVEVSGGGVYTAEINKNGVKAAEVVGGVAADGAPKIVALTPVSAALAAFVADDLISVKVDTTGRTGAWEGAVSFEG